MIPSYAAAFVAGLATFLAPCTLPLVPAYLGFLSGSGADRRRILRAAVLFILGFSAVFISFGILVGFLGSVLGPARAVIQRVGGVIVIFLGLSLLGILRLPILQRGFGFSPQRVRGLPPNLRAFLFGVIVSSGWTPCIGPILGTILFVAASTATVGTGAALLAVYSVGLAVPFLGVALFYGQAAKAIARLRPLTRAIEVTAGIFLVFLGILFATDRMTAFIAGAYRLLDFVNYDRLYNVL